MSLDLPLHGGQLRRIAEHHDLRADALLDFSANINPDGPPASVLAALREGLGDPRVISAYPDLDLPELKQAIAGFAGVPEETVVIANGFVPLLESTLRLLRIRRCLLPVPAFVEYRRVLERAGVTVAPRPLSEDRGLRYDLDAFLEGAHDAILLANPQNPSGVLTEGPALLAFVQRAASLGITVLLDEAFIDYAPEHSLANETERLPNLVVFRSVTKFLGVAGLRVAYSIVHREIAHALREGIAPWPVTTLAAIAVKAGLADTEFSKASRQRNEHRRTELQNALHELGFHTYPSVANFLLIRPSRRPEAQEIHNRLLTGHSIAVRNCDNYEALSSGHIRVAVRSSGENDRLLHGMREIAPTEGNRIDPGFNSQMH